MDKVESRTVLEPNETNTADDIIELTLRALRLDYSKVPHSNKATTAGKYDNLAEITLQEVSDHDCIEDCWVVVYDRVYDVTKFLDKHPGGWDVILDYAGMDCTIAFRGTGHSKEAIDMLDKYLIGKLPSHQQIFRKQTGGIRFSDMPE